MKYCKHGVDRTDSKCVSRHGCKNADMYVYKGGAGRGVVHDVWAGVCKRPTGSGHEWDMSERQRARGTPYRQADTRDRKRGNENDQRWNHPVSERQRAVRVVEPAGSESGLA